MKKILPFIILLFSLTCFAQSSADEALAMQYYQNGDFEKSVILLRKLFNQGKVDIYDLYFINLLKLKQFDEADKVVKKLIKSNPTRYNYQVDYGKLLQAEGEDEKAKAWNDDLIKNLPKSAFSVRDLATTFYRAELYDYSVQTFLAGRKLLKSDTEFAYDLISLYRIKKNKELLVQEYLNVLQTNPELQMQAQSVLATIFEDNADYEMLKSTLLRRLQKDPQNVTYTELLTWQYIQQKEFDLALKQTIALDRRLKEDGNRINDLYWLLMSNQAYTSAIDALQYLINKGPENSNYISARIQLLNTKNQMLTAGKFSNEELLQLEKDYQSLLTELGKTTSTAFAMQQLANLQAFYLDRPKDAEVMLETLLKLPNLPAAVMGQTKMDLANVYILTGEVWEADLTYSQVEKQFPDAPMGQEAKFRNATLSYYQGDFSWAKAQLDVLKSSTSQLIANDALNLNLLISENSGSAADTNALRTYARADLLIFKNKLPDALKTLDSIDEKYPGNSLKDDILMAKSKIYIKQNDYQLASAQLQKLVDTFQTGLWADDAVFTLADLFETKFNDPEKAKVLYQKLITDYPGSLYVIEARKRFRTLRGDKIG